MTDVYSFELERAPEDWTVPLVLRVYPDGTDASAVRRERCAQDVVAAQGVPAPRVLACEDTARSLDRPFMIMERLPGHPQMRIDLPGLLIGAPRLLTLPRRHAGALNMVHELDADPMLEAMAAAGIDRRQAGPEHWLEGAEATIARWGLDGLRPGLEWLRSNRPPDPSRVSICHGDLFGANILETRGRVTGIVDWNLVTVGDPAIDLGGQIAAYQMSAVPGPRALQLGVTSFGLMLARGLRRQYAKLRELSADVVRYYAVMRAFTEMTYKLGTQRRVLETGIPERMPTWRPDQCARYIARRTNVALEPPR